MRTLDIPLRTIKFFCSLLFGVFVHAAGRHKQTFDGASPTVRSTLHGRRQCFIQAHWGGFPPKLRIPPPPRN